MSEFLGMPKYVPDAAVNEAVVRNVTEEFPWEAFEGASVDLDAQRLAFIESGYSKDINLCPTEINQEMVDTFTEELTTILFNLSTTVSDPNARLLYTWRINEQLANVEMVVSACNGNMSKFREDNDFLYGPPDPEVFGATAAWFVDEAQQAIEAEMAKPPTDIRAGVVLAASRVLKALGGSSGDKKVLIPDDAVFQAARERSYAEGGFMHKLLDDIELPEGMINASNGDEIIRKMLTNIGSHPVIEDSSSWSVTAEALKRPADYNMTRQEFIEFLSHELRHRYETVLGVTNRLRLPTTGISRYEQGNEGRGVVTEALTNEKFEDFTKGFRWHELLGRHLAASMSRGMAAGQGANFASTYNVLKDAMIVFEAQKPDAGNIEEIIKQAHDHAWDIVSLVYEGTDGTGKGGGWLRPMIYLQGFTEVFKKEAKHPGIIEVGDRGKFNVADDAQMSLLATLDVVDPHDLLELAA